MTNRPHKPGIAYWGEVAKLSNTLAGRGETVYGSAPRLGRFALTWTEWDCDETHNWLKLARLGPVSVSFLDLVTTLAETDMRKSALGYTAFVRTIGFMPLRVTAVLPVEGLEAWEHLSDNPPRAGYRIGLDGKQHYTTLGEREYPEQLAPTAELYTSLLDALRQGEAITR